MSSTIEILDSQDVNENTPTKGKFFKLSRCVPGCINIITGKKKRATLGNPVATDADGLLMDVDVQPVDDNRPTREDKRQDVDWFFHTAIVKESNGKSKKFRACKICP